MEFPFPMTSVMPFIFSGIGYLSRDVVAGLEQEQLA